MEELKRCRYCRATQRVIKKGTRKNRRGDVQIYRCLNCFRYFTYDLGFLKMRYKKETITKSIDLWIKGASLSKVRDHLEQFDGTRVHESTILRWTRKYISQIKKHLDESITVNSMRWSADETAIVIKGGGLYWLWQMIDKDTRFLIATHVSASRHITETKIFFQKALDASNRPKEITTDGLLSYIAAHDDMMKDVQHRTPTGFRDKVLNNQMIERQHGIMKDRLKPMRGLYSQKTAQDFINALQIYYNFIKPHKSLLNATPSDVANVKPSLKQNKWLSLIEEANR